MLWSWARPRRSPPPSVLQPEGAGSRTRTRVQRELRAPPPLQPRERRALYGCRQPRAGGQHAGADPSLMSAAAPRPLQCVRWVCDADGGRCSNARVSAIATCIGILRKLSTSGGAFQRPHCACVCEGFR
jgi:hypothetical protein